MWYSISAVKKNPHAVALGRRGGLVGGRRGGLARARALSPERRREIARKAASTRWGTAKPAERASSFPVAIRQLLKTYDPDQLRWDVPADRWAIVSAILTRGSAEARSWLNLRIPMKDLRALARQFKGAGLDEEDRAKVRTELGLTETDIPRRPFPEFTGVVVKIRDE
jgi:hypothetical protein